MSDLISKFSPEDIEALISTAVELYENASDSHEYLSIRQQGVLALASEGAELSDDDIEALLRSAAELYDNAHDAEQCLSIRQQGLSSTALRYLGDL